MSDTYWTSTPPLSQIQPSPPLFFESIVPVAFFFPSVLINLWGLVLFLTEFPYVVQAGLKLAILLPQPPAQAADLVLCVESESPIPAVTVSQVTREKHLD